MNEQWGRYRGDLSAVAASAARLAESAMASANTAVEAASRKLDAARDRQARKRDPKARHLKALRGAKNTVLGWSAGTSTAAATSAVGFAAAAPVVGGTAAGATVLLAVPLGYAATKLRRLRRRPMPPRGYARRDLPPGDSALYRPIRMLAGAEQQFLALTAVLSSSEVLPPDAITELDDEADAAAATIVAYAARLRDLEAAVRSTGGPSHAQLESALTDGVRRVEQGVDAYIDMVESAGMTVAAAQGGLGVLAGFDGAAMATAQLQDNADRLRAWALGISALPPTPTR
jgi:hypothetical protein